MIDTIHMRELSFTHMREHQHTARVLQEAADEIERRRVMAEQDARLRQACLELRDEARQENKRLLERIQILEAELRVAYKLRSALSGEALPTPRRDS